MNKRIVVDPITRIEGHLRIEAELGEDQSIQQRLFLRHHGARHRTDPEGPRSARSLGLRAAHLRRLHAGSWHRLGARGGKRAWDTIFPPMPQLIRNLMVGAQYVHDHVMHFYHLHALDWVDVVSALKADPEGDVGTGAIASRPTRNRVPAISPRCKKA